VGAILVRPSEPVAQVEASPAIALGQRADVASAALDVVLRET
jgi:hypothetical protein